MANVRQGQKRDRVLYWMGHVMVVIAILYGPFIDLIGNSGQWSRATFNLVLGIWLIERNR